MAVSLEDQFRQDFGYGTGNNKVIPDTKKEELLLYHQQFLQNPISTQIRKLLEKHEANIVDFLATKAISNDTTDQQFRNYAVQLAETRKIIKTIFDAETFINKSTKL